MAERRQTHRDMERESVTGGMMGVSRVYLTGWPARASPKRGHSHRDGKVQAAGLLQVGAGHSRGSGSKRQKRGRMGTGLVGSGMRAACVCNQWDYKDW